MPTARKRFQVTETDDVERALDAAALVWPDESWSRLLLRVIHAGGEAVLQDPAAVVMSRGAAIERVQGAYGEVFDGDYLARLREDWPE
jgi:hypothetical protein